MAQSFGTTAIELNIGVSAYMLALGVFVPASGIDYRIAFILIALLALAGLIDAMRLRAG